MTTIMADGQQQSSEIITKCAQIDKNKRFKDYLVMENSISERL